MRHHDRLVDSSLSVRWSKLDIQSECPCPRSFHSLSVFPAPAQIRRLFDENCPSLQCAVVTGGRDDSTVFNDVWVLLFATEPNANVTPHWRRASVHMAQTDSTHESAATASELLCRAYHTSTYRRTNSDGSAELWLYGGKCSTGDGPAPFIGTMLKLTVSAQPEKVYGDCNQDIRCAFTVSVECVTQQNALGNRAYHTAALHGTRRLVVYGGFTGVEFVDVVSTFDLETATWSHHCPTPAMHPAVAYDFKHNADVASAAVSGASEATPTSTPQKPADQLRVPELCRTCGALSSCVHRSRQLQRLCDGKRILSTSPSVSNRPFASRPPTTSFPPRDASTLIRVGAVDDDAAPLFCFGGEVMQTFYNSMIKLSLGREASQWITLCDGVEIHADEDSDSPARRYSGATPPSLDRVFRAAVKDIVCSPERKLQFDDVDEVSEIIATQTCAPCAAPAPLPEPRAYHCAWAVGGRAVAVWGGFALQKRRAKFFGDLAVFDVHRCCWVPVQTNDGAAPPARASASCVQINEHGHALLFGGDDGTAYFNDSWICAFATGTEAAEFDSRVTLRAAAQRFLLSAATVSVEKPVS